ncbi:MAG: thioesterase family protein [Novosphingobium sp.]
MSLAGILAAATLHDDGLAATIPPGWLQGRTSYGGLSSMLALEAARRAGGELPPLRSAQVAFVGPLSGEVEARAKVLRRGRNATWMSAEVAGEGGVGLLATFVFMAPVASNLHLDQSPPPPGLIAPEEAAEIPDRGRPVFLANFDTRFAIPRDAERRPELCWWVRHRDRSGLDAMSEVLSIADALPPGVLPLLRERVNVSSMTWQVNLLTPAPATRDGWWLLRSRGSYAESGCSSQEMAVWNADGLPVVAGMQSVALFG